MKKLTSLFATLILWFGSVSSAAAIEPTYTDFFGNAIRGYDPVAYFTESKPTKGSNNYKLEWNGADWHFTSQENLELFAANPNKYAPQYGGYCAWAVSKRYTAKIDPNAWYIHDDKLYLNYSKSVQSTWQQDIPGNIANADKFWPQLLDD
ncbi:YHS domain-containing (seleno)protein [Vibrio mexicanus]|uniref:YHS domain-containing (seleno)protein n=1 Tax=Vibrio mexicanus TaxID=1004326 RepID=UPI00063C6C1F|nr:YHS domain-containing (seleno)protein [Vibrio mexicanus]